MEKTVLYNIATSEFGHNHYNTQYTFILQEYLLSPFTP